MSLAEHVRTMGRGPGRSRSLTKDEAFDAMQHMLATPADQAATGALLMLLRMKGETADEIAGLAFAAQDNLPALSQVDLDWPSYAAGRTRGLPWFLLSARLVAMAGHRVLLHGWNGNDTAVRSALTQAGIKMGRNAVDTNVALAQEGIAYFGLEDLSPALFDLLQLREKTGLRSCVNTVCRMLNPACAQTSVQGVFHPSYRQLQADAAQRLGWTSLSVIKGGGGEFERNPTKNIAAFGLRKGSQWQTTLPALRDETRRISEGPNEIQRLSDVWSGEYNDPFAKSIVLGTATAALDTLGIKNPDHRVRELWAERTQRQAA